jgi:hypothetical protein
MSALNEVHVHCGRVVSHPGETCHRTNRCQGAPCGRGVASGGPLQAPHPHWSHMGCPPTGCREQATALRVETNPTSKKTVVKVRATHVHVFVSANEGSFQQQTLRCACAW